MNWKKSGAHPVQQEEKCIKWEKEIIKSFAELVKPQFRFSFVPLEF